MNALWVWVLIAWLVVPAYSNDPFEIQVVDGETGRGVPLIPAGHPLVHSDDGKSFVYFAQPYPNVRVLANADSLGDLSQYETYTYLKKGSRDDSAEVERDENGKLVYDWKTDTTSLTPKLEKQLLNERLIKPAEALLQTKDIATGKTVMLHGGSAYWNDYRKRWIMIAVESFGTSMLGEVWFSESDSLTGPWRWLAKSQRTTSTVFTIRNSIPCLTAIRAERSSLKEPIPTCFRQPGSHTTLQLQSSHVQVGSGGPAFETGKPQRRIKHKKFVNQ